MAYVAFDLDATLGFFEITNPLAFFWSPDWLENPEQSALNGRLTLSHGLRVKLSRARIAFANALFANKELLDIVLRPNLDAFFPQLIKAKKAKRVKSIIIYSNTSVTYSMELAKMLIEKKFRAPRLFSLMADHWSPLRDADRPRVDPGRYVQPEKTITTLKVLFQRATKSAVTNLSPDKIMFMDDRHPKHKLEAQEKEGLKYIVPSAFYPQFTERQKKNIIFLALKALDEQGVISDTDYLSSGFCNRVIPYNNGMRQKVSGFVDLFKYVWERMVDVKCPDDPWVPDTADLESQVDAFLEKS